MGSGSGFRSRSAILKPPTTTVREQALAVLAVGSPRLQADELADRRYGLSDLLDELAGSTDPGETFVICWNVIVESAELAFLLAGSWLGTGKWFLRELRAADPVLADRADRGQR